MANEGEKRRFKRYWRAQLKINRFFIRDSQAFPVCKNISAGGVMIGSQDYFAKGTEVSFVLGLPGWKEFATAAGLAPSSDDVGGRMTIMWVGKASEGGYNLGGQFVVDNPAWQKTLEAYLEAHEQKPGLRRLLR